MQLKSEYLQLIAEKLCRKPVNRITDGGSGANCRIIKVECENEYFALKFYRNSSVGQCNRIEAETLALSFFEKYGITETPKLIAYDSENNCSLLEWVVGDVVDEVSEERIGALVAFLGQLHQVRSKPDAKKFTLGTEACLSLKELLRQLNMRIERLYQTFELKEFICQEFEPAINEFGDWAKDSKFNMEKELAQELQTLSPVDFGFHNTLTKSNGDLVFLDFEYFGWADPVNLISDTLLHPACKFNNGQKQLFFSLISKIYSDCDISDRLKVFYPLYGLRWCAIMLNLFLPGYVMPGEEKLTKDDKKRLKQEKLTKVRCLLKEIYSYKHEFPYV